MRITLKVISTTDPLFLPWDIHAETEDGLRFPTIQEPHPYHGDRIMGFEEEPQQCEIIIGRDDWQEQAIGKSPVCIGKGGAMYSIPTYKVREVIVHE